VKTFEKFEGDVNNPPLPVAYSILLKHYWWRIDLKGLYKVARIDIKLADSTQTTVLRKRDITSLEHALQLNGSTS